MPKASGRILWSGIIRAWAGESKMSRIEDHLNKQDERLARIEQKVDDWMNQAVVHREEQRLVCTNHRDWTASVEKKVEDLQGDRAKVIGAGKVLVWLGSGGTLAGLLMKLLHHKAGGTP